jgi:ethanolamine transporter EutH
MALARFRGNVHAGSDRLAATLLVLALLVIIGLVFWDNRDPRGFTLFWDNIAAMLHVNR